MKAFISYCLPALLVCAFLCSESQAAGNSVTKVDVLDERDARNGLHHVYHLEEARDARTIVIDEQLKHVYVGAVDYLYAFDLDNVETKIAEFHWMPNPELSRFCHFHMVENKEICQNIIHVLHSVNRTHLYACGTSASETWCIYIDKRTFKQDGPKIPGKSKSPKDDRSSVVSTMTDGFLFSAITREPSKGNGFIAKSSASGSDTLSTYEFDDFCLSDPQFVSAFTVPEEENGQAKVVVLLRENAEEIPSELLTQDSDYSLNLVYSRLATVCVNDNGGSKWSSDKNRLATFTKMRIACPVPIQHGKSRSISFFYDEIQSSYVIPNPEEPDNPLIYAVFSTPRSSGGYVATATCIFEMRHIRERMTTTKYWNKPDGKSSNLFSIYNNPSYPAPGSCANDTSQFPNSRAEYGMKHPLKFGIIKPKDGFAIYQDSGFNYSHIIVDRIRRKEKFEGDSEIFEREYDVVHYITDTGFIKRVVFSVEDRSNFWEIPSRELYDESDTKHTIMTVKKANGYLYFGTTKAVFQLRIAACSSYASCGDCRLSNDPYCNWDGDFDIACKDINFNSPITPQKMYKRLNETGCGASEPPKRKNSHDQLGERTIEGILLQNEKLRNQTRGMNQTISLLTTERDQLKYDLSDTVDEMSRMMNNFTHLSAFLMQCQTTRKHLVDLYVATVRANQNCRLRVEADADAIRKLKSRRNTSAECLQRKSEPKVECICDSDVIEGGSRVLEKDNRQQHTKLSACKIQVDKLESEIEELEVSQKNLTRQQSAYKRTIHSLKRENIKLLTSSGKNCGGQGQWYYYQPSSKLFFITQSSVNFEEAKKQCSNVGGTLAQMKDDDEARYIFNITHSVTPKKRYWVGLKKYANRLIQWTDGAVFEERITRRFPKSQKSRIESSIEYCVETTHRALEWQLIPCHRSRRVVCMKYYDMEVR